MSVTGIPQQSQAEGLLAMPLQPPQAVSNRAVALNTACPGMPHNSKSYTFVCLSATKIITLEPAGEKKIPTLSSEERAGESKGLQGAFSVAR